MFLIALALLCFQGRAFLFEDKRSSFEGTISGGHLKVHSECTRKR